MIGRCCAFVLVSGGQSFKVGGVARRIICISVQARLPFYAGVIWLDAQHATM